MRLLLDSHVVVWWAVYPGRLTPAVRDAIRDPANGVHLSAASIWELGLKIALGKLRLPADYADRLLSDGFEPLSVTASHANRAMTLPAIHGDPFDRMLVAQALEEGLVLVTADRNIARYDVPVMET